MRIDGGGNSLVIPDQAAMAYLTDSTTQANVAINTTTRVGFDQFIALAGDDLPSLNADGGLEFSSNHVGQLWEFRTQFRFLDPGTSEYGQACYLSLHNLAFTGSYDGALCFDGRSRSSVDRAASIWFGCQSMTYRIPEPCQVVVRYYHLNFTSANTGFVGTTTGTFIVARRIA